MTATTNSDADAQAATAAHAEHGEDSPGPGARPTFTITEAATACAVSRKTITRKLAELGDAGAAKDADGIWRIPVEALLSVGLHPGRSLTPGTTRREPVVDLRSARQAPVEQAPAPETITVPRDRWDDMRIRLARAEAESTERGRALEDARLALRALTAGPSSYPAPENPGVAASAPWEPAVAPAPHVEPAVARPDLMAGRGAGEHASGSTGGYEVPEPVPGLPPTPVPHSLAADSSVWDTLLPRSAAPAATMVGTVPPAAVPTAHVPPASVPPAPVPSGPAPVAAVNGGQPASPSDGVPGATHEQYQSGQPYGVAEPPAPGQVMVAPRRRWWGGKR